MHVNLNTHCLYTDGISGQVLMLREKLEEKDHELEKLKHELRQKSILEEDKNDSVSDKNIGNDVTVSGEAVSWDEDLSNFVGYL